MPVATTGKQPGSTKVKSGSINKTVQIERVTGSFMRQGS
jgi:hypothetical protein